MWLECLGKQLKLPGAFKLEFSRFLLSSKQEPHMTPGRVFAMLWAAPCFFLQGSSQRVQGESSVLEEPKGQALNGIFCPIQTTGGLKPGLGDAGPTWALSHLSGFKEQGTQGTQAVISVTTASTSTTVASGDVTPPRSTAFCHRWPDYNV